MELTVPNVKIKKVEIPRILIGTSPFLAAGQFEKSHEYYYEFVLNPKNIVDILAYCFRLGVRGVQLIAYDFLINSIIEASKATGLKPIIVASLSPEDPIGSLNQLQELNPSIVLLHAAQSESMSNSEISDLLSNVKEKLNVVTGVALHNPIKSLPRILPIPEVEVVMVPLNYAGIFVKGKEEVIKMLREAKKPVIAKKVLGAGRLDVEKALSWIFNQDIVKSVAIGVASKDEALRTFSKAIEILTKNDEPQSSPTSS